MVTFFVMVVYLVLRFVFNVQIGGISVHDLMGLFAIIAIGGIITSMYKFMIEKKYKHIIFVLLNGFLLFFYIKIYTAL